MLHRKGDSFVSKFLSEKRIRDSGHPKQDIGKNEGGTQQAYQPEHRQKLQGVQGIENTRTFRESLKNRGQMTQGQKQLKSKKNRQPFDHKNLS